MSNKSQRADFLQAKRNENKEIILTDSAGVEFFVPQINEKVHHFIRGVYPLVTIQLSIVSKRESKVILPMVLLSSTEYLVRSSMVLNL